MSLRETALTALFARLNASLAARNPAPVIRRNETVPQRLPAGGLVVLRDGESVSETPKHLGEGSATRLLLFK
jgi:hypothetical protein